MTDAKVIQKVIDRAVSNGYKGILPGCDKCGLDWHYILFSHEFARAFWGDKFYRIGRHRSSFVKEYRRHLQAMAAYDNPFRYLEKFFIETERVYYQDFIFGKDVLMETAHEYVVDSKDEWSPPGEDYTYHYKPVAMVSDFWNGEEFARALLERFPEKRKLLDLGTATGSVPLTMRRAGMWALGIEGLPVKEYDFQNYMLRVPELFCWKVCPELVTTCDITQPFRIVDGKGNPVRFDYIISTDCFEHLKEERIPTLIDNIYEHLDGDGYGIFEINTTSWFELHQTIRPGEWWQEQFQTRFEVCRELTEIDFPYIRSDRKGGILTYKDSDEPASGKILFWIRKKQKQE